MGVKASPDKKRDVDLKHEKALKEFTPLVTIVDAVPSEPKEGIITNKQIDNTETLKTIFGEKYISPEQLSQEFGDGYKKHWGKVYEKYPQQALVNQFADIYLSHGEKVAYAMEKIWNKMGLKSTGINMKPVQSIIDKDKTEYKIDEIGNPSMTINFNKDLLEQLLENNKNRVINCSFEIGNVTVRNEFKRKIIPEYGIPYLEGNNGEIYIGKTLIPEYDEGKLYYTDNEGNKIKPVSKEEFEAMQKQKKDEAEKNATFHIYENPYLDITGAYDATRVSENIQQVFELASKYPDKLFVLAAGNEEENLLAITQELADKRPPNILFVGCLSEGEAYGVHGKYMFGGVKGADVYVKNKDFGLPDASSFSTPAISAVAEALFQKGLTIDEVKQKITSASRSFEYSKSSDSPDILQTFVFDKSSLNNLQQ